MDPDATIPSLVQASIRRHADAVAVASCAKQGKDALTYREFGEAVELLALGLDDLGVRKGDRVALVAPNSVEWQLADQALLHLGAVTVPLYETVPPQDQAFVVQDAEARVLLAYDDARADRLDAYRKDLPALARVVTLTPSPSRTSLTDLTARGREVRAKDPERFRRAWQAVRPDDVATFVYTSGTTGRPKGVVLTHRNLAFNTLAIPAIARLGPGDATVSFLPLSHSLQRAAEFVFLAYGVSIHYAESLEKLPDHFRDVRPSVLVGVPRVWEKAYHAVLAKVRAEPRWKQALFHAALAGGLAVVAAEDRGATPNPVDAATAAFGRAVVFKPLRERFGGRLRYLVSGGAPLDPGVERFFHAAGIMLLQGYGLTEAGPILTINAPEAHRSGTVGRALAGVELRLDDEGEIVARGPGIARGYWKRPEDTAATFADGWLRTGDVGALDADGFLRITDRKKELLVLSNGKKVPPAPVEKRLEAEAVVRQAVLLGEAQRFCAALVVPEPLAFGGRAVEDLARDAKVQEAVERAVERVNEALPRHEQVKRVRLLSRELTVEAGDLTPTLKVKRRVVAERFAKEIEDLFRP